MSVSEDVVSNQWVLPDYRGGGITNLISSISTALGGGEKGYPPLHGLDLDRLRRARSVVLLVVDGLGYEYLQQQGDGSNLKSHCLDAMTSVCPSTTASAIPTFLTGVPPMQHGFTGWFTYFSELGTVLTVLPFGTRLGQMPVDVISPSDLSGVAPLYDSLNVDSSLVMPDWIAGSTFNKAFSGDAKIVPYRGLKQFEDNIFKASSESGFTYAYWPEFDAMAHEFGVGSPEVQNHFWQLDDTLGNLIERLKGSDTLLLVTADHGFIDTTAERRIRLSDHPRLAETLMVPLCGEPRLVFCYVHPDRVQQFETYVKDHLSNEISLCPSSKLLEEGWFGLGEPHPHLRDRVGHYTLVMNENYVISGELPGERPLGHIGVHGGISSKEMLVPLICVAC